MDGGVEERGAPCVAPEQAAEDERALVFGVAVLHAAARLARAGEHADP
ncbi:MAG: hypothetical protein P8Y36_07425 [Alphaproteobacteria bacterium]